MPSSFCLRRLWSNPFLSCLLLSSPIRVPFEESTVYSDINIKMPDLKRQPRFKVWLLFFSLGKLMLGDKIDCSCLVLSTIRSRPGTRRCALCTQWMVAFCRMSWLVNINKHVGWNGHGFTVTSQWNFIENLIAKLNGSQLHNIWSMAQWLGGNEFGVF